VANFNPNGCFTQDNPARSVRKVPAKYQNDPVLRNVAERCLDTIYVKAGSTITMKYAGGWDGRRLAALYLAPFV
jgi:hypothetical protein